MTVGKFLIVIGMLALLFAMFAIAVGMEGAK
jgi:hypothetical protein